MNKIFTLLFGLFITAQLSAQVEYSSTDINLTIGDSWIHAYSGYVDFDAENLGIAGENGVYDLSSFGTAEDWTHYTSINEINENNGVIASLVEETELTDLPADLPRTTHYLKYDRYEYWGYDVGLFEGLNVTSEGIMSHGGYLVDETSTPAEYSHMYDLYFQSAPSKISMNETMIMTRTTIAPTVDPSKELKTIVTEEITLDGIGEYTSPWGETYSDVYRFVINKNLLGTVRQQGGDWQPDFDENQKIIVYRTKGNLMPLAAVVVSDSWTDGATGNMEVNDIVFFKPLNVSSSINRTEFSNSAIDIAPNPASDFINITIHAADQKYVNINWFNTQGILVKQEEIDLLNSDNHFASQTPDASGIYYLQITNDKYTTTKKVMVSK